MTVKQILNETKQFLETVTGMEVVSVQYKVKYRPENIERLKVAICRAYDTTMDKLMVRKRKIELVQPRYMFYYFAIEMFSMEVTEAGMVFGHDHTNAIHGRDKVKDFIYIEDPETLEKIKLVSEYLNN